MVLSKCNWELKSNTGMALTIPTVLWHLLCQTSWTEAFCEIYPAMHLHRQKCGRTRLFHPLKTLAMVEVTFDDMNPWIVHPMSKAYTKKFPEEMRTKTRKQAKGWCCDLRDMQDSHVSCWYASKYGTWAGVLTLLFTHQRKSNLVHTTVSIAMPVHSFISPRDSSKIQLAHNMLYDCNPQLRFAVIFQ